MRIRLVVTDLDDTILRRDGSFSAKTQQVFKRLRAAGIPAAFATARFHTAELADQLKAAYTINTDGTLIQTAGGEMICKWTFSRDAANGILDCIHEIDPDTDVVIPVQEEIRRNCQAPFWGDALKIVAQLPEGAAEKIARNFDCKVIRYRGENRYSFLPPKAGKVEAIRALADFLGIRMAEVASFGDDLGDIPMLSACGLGVAVENALPEVREAADCVCSACEEDGVAKFLEKHLLQDSGTETDCPPCENRYISLANRRKI